MSLERFFDRAEDLLLGRINPREFQKALGKSPSGRTRVGFYRVLVKRNMDKILREMYPSVMVLANREHPGMWAELVEDFTSKHPSVHRNPNDFGRPFPAYLSERAKWDGRIDSLYEEVADFHWLEYEAHTALDEIPEDKRPDGLEHRLFVRQYSAKITEFARAARTDPTVPRPEPGPVQVLIYRDPGSCLVKVLYATVYSFAVLSRRQGGDPAAVVPGLDAAVLDRVEQELISKGVLIAPDEAKAAIASE